MRLSHLTKAAAVAGVIAAPLAFSAAPSFAATTGSPSSAFGIEATGLVNIPATPSVQSPASKSVLQLPANPLLKASVLKAAARPGHAKASVVSLNLIPARIKAEVITAACTNGVGNSKLVNVVIAGEKLPVKASPNTNLNIGLGKAGSVDVTINKQVKTSDGRLSVTALELAVNLAGKVQTVSIAGATCGNGNGMETPPVTPPAQKPPTNTAPVPTPIKGDLPVTG
ncbi:MAG: hypothetical protein JWO67_6735 [Streptosporangiaceae bacterium]|nr:hypothetical protein [Streptosporangiaceae bacterium]